MLNFDIAYLLTVTAALAAAYLVFYYFIYWLHTSQFPRPISRQSVGSVLVIVAFSLFVYAVSYQLPGFVTGFGNRVIHAMGGGFLVMMLCYFVAKDTQLNVNKWKYFIFCFMLTTTLGVFNEIAESILQNVFHFTSAITINDTWFDLISNTVGAILGGAIFIPLLKK